MNNGISNKHAYQWFKFPDSKRYKILADYLQNIEDFCRMSQNWDSSKIFQNFEKSYRVLHGLAAKSCSILHNLTKIQKISDAFLAAKV